MLRPEVSKNLRTYLDPAIKSELHHKTYIERLLTDDALFTHGNLDQMHWRVRRLRCRSNVGTIRRIHSDSGMRLINHRGFEGKSVHLLVITLPTLRSIPLILHERRTGVQTGIFATLTGFDTKGDRPCPPASGRRNSGALF
jgi:hypothetical protein